MATSNSNPIYTTLTDATFNFIQRNVGILPLAVRNPLEEHFRHVIDQLRARLRQYLLCYLAGAPDGFWIVHCFLLARRNSNGG
jgi:hypothetical protein